MKKRFLAVFLALALCLGLAPVTALAADSDFVINDGVLVKYNGPGGDVTIPNSVIEIGDFSFSECAGLTSVTIPNGVTKIGKLAFQGCTSLTRVAIPASVKVMEAHVFDVDIRVGWEYSALENLKDIYYGGTKEQWDAISIDEENETLKTAAIHFDPAVTVEGPGSEIPKEDREFTLRNFTAEETVQGSRYSTIQTIFTRSTETETVSVKDISTLTLGAQVTVSGLRPSDSDGASPWDIASLCAWSDPDGDGIYDQRLLTHTSQRNNFTALPTSEEGPLSYYHTDVENYFCPIYRLNANLCGTDALTYHWCNMGDVVFPDTVAVSAERLTKLFGPNTLIKLDVAEGAYSQNTSPDAGEFSFYFLIPEGQAVPPAFTDVPGWCAGAVDWAVDQGITDGTGEGKFSPHDLCKHAEILTFLWRAAGRPTSSAEQPCDITGKNLGYAEAALRWAAEKGMIDGTLDPAARCTRADAVNYLYLADFYRWGGSGKGFPDVPADADYAGAVDWAATHNVVTGYEDGTFQPDKTCSRGEIVTLLHRAYVPTEKIYS